MVTTLTPKTKVLADSSFLYALADPQDKFHQEAIKFSRDYPNLIRIIPDVALTEVTQLLTKFVSYRAMTRFLQTISVSDIILEPITKVDIERASAIMEKYADAHLDFVDCCIMALSERLKITEICSFDHRDFMIFKPSHCDLLELLP